MKCCNHFLVAGVACRGLNSLIPGPPQASEEKRGVLWSILSRVQPFETIRYGRL